MDETNNKMDKHYFRGSGRTWRDLFELASKTSKNPIYFISRTTQESKYNLRRFVDLMRFINAPIEIHKCQSVKIGRINPVEYRFIGRETYDSLLFKHGLPHDTKTVFDHHCWA